MKTLSVELGERSYPIYIGDLVLSAERLSEHIKSQEVVVISNTTVAALYLETLKKYLNAYTVICFELDDGERYKNLASVEKIYDFMLENQVSRKATIIALGGGVVGDIAGFVAASYQRGIPFIQIPTTLLSQVDSSVGGKTGVNHPLGKNMIGAFYQPQAVFIQLPFLKTLDERQYAAGIAEVIKYGFLGDKSLHEYLKKNMPLLLQQDTEILTHAIVKSCENKARIVAEDERESGKRALLNLGHSFGHAIEALEGYKGLLHGEAVAVGMLMAADLSRLLGYLSQSDIDEIKLLLESAELPTKVPSGLTSESLRNAMNLDKKNVAGSLRLVLLKAIGDAYIEANVDESQLQKTLKSFV